MNPAVSSNGPSNDRKLGEAARILGNRAGLAAQLLILFDAQPIAIGLKLRRGYLPTGFLGLRLVNRRRIIAELYDYGSGTTVCADGNCKRPAEKCSDSKQGCQHNQHRAE